MYDENGELLPEYQSAFIYPFEIVVFDLADGTDKVIAPGKWPTWSGDGQKLIFTSTSPGGLLNSQIHMFDLVTEQEDILAQGFQSILSPDGKRLVFGRPDATRLKDIDIETDQYMAELLGPGMGLPVSIYANN